jgi:hypothetical protein
MTGSSGTTARRQINLRDHQVPFELAKLAFDDPNAVDDPDEDPDEERWNLVGMAEDRILFVTYTYRGSRIRIISARKANRREQDRYYTQE